jgi:TPP-dependent pyruvate/acetoin dehydrogenase alpha subunit
MDVTGVAAAVRAAVADARGGRGPTLIECKTYRFLGHSKSDQRVYRSREEEGAWRERDPIVRLSSAMQEQGLASASELETIAHDAVAAVDAAVEFARRSPYPEPHCVTEGLFTNGPSHA